MDFITFETQLKEHLALPGSYWLITTFSLLNIEIDK